MAEVGAQRQIVLHNLATHAAQARARLRLSLPDAARLADLTLEGLADLENGRNSTLSLAALTRLALFLGLTESGVPRPLPPGME
ncbi:helix-turn-helix domain-containing protein [Methylobacterium sp. J-070]|uniref:helix-turn-helix domain-containing protein n=1 Tax=Methylobacterium sp. J-070 TaxID=2836650 RepID=UPI001FBC0560|nr:helix-turn-helix transcriptional regulator [Methylobacterium sp. J-070]MCJ2049367.1 helix-turn-helix domain-containing protein [Methylobacterium sp. J-070]